MKDAVKTSRAVGYLEKMFRQLNADFFGGELEMPIITIQSTPHAYGHVTTTKIWKVKDGSAYELNLGAENLYRPVESVVATMLHEMVHIYHLMHNIQDTSRGNAYHNKKFKEKAESVLLKIDYDKGIGWSITSPTYELIDYIAKQGWTEIYINRGAVSAASGASGSPDDLGKSGKVKKPSSTRKYICPVCKCTFRATREIRAVCGECWYDRQEIVDMIQEL